MKLQYSVETINEVLGYLSTKPFGEVYKMVTALQQGERIEEEVGKVGGEEANDS